jgi:hypothetical protein
LKGKAVCITVSCDKEFIEVTGDVMTRLSVPCPADPDHEAVFALALSDGALIEGRLDDDGYYHFVVSQEGVGMTRIIPRGFIHDGQVASITLTPTYPVLAQVGLAEWQSFSLGGADYRLTPTSCGLLD